MGANISKRNHEGYLDMTAYYALSKIEKEERAARRKPPAILNINGVGGSNKPPLPLVYVASPYRPIGACADLPLVGQDVFIKRNVQNAIRYSRYVLEQGKMPVAPHIWLPRFMNDNDPHERETATLFGLWLVAQCSQLWVFGDYISAGMRAEIETAKRLRLNVRCITSAEIKNLTEEGLL